MKTYIFLIISYLALNQINAQMKDRNVLWIHGLGGSNESWITNSNFHSGRYKMKSVSPSYGSGAGVTGSAQKVKNQIKDQLKDDANDSKNFVIAHSFGGLVTRSLEMQNDKGGEKQNFGGYITVHTAHAGAQFAANFHNGVYKKGLDNIVDNITKPFKKEALDDLLININNIFGPFIKGSLKELVEFIYNALNTWTGNDADDKLKEFAGMRGFLDPAKIGDLTPGSRTLEELNDYDGPGEKITVWGGEESNIFYRLMSSLTVGPGDEALDIVSDEKLDNVFNGAASVFSFMGEVNRSLGIAADITGVNLIKKIITGKTTDFHARARAWYDGSNYLKTQLETDWLTMIGANGWKDEFIETTQMTKSCSDRMGTLLDLLSKAVNRGDFERENEIEEKLEELGNNPNCYEKVKQVVQVPVKLGTDGVVNEDTQKAGGGILFENKNCNHFEALNTKVMSDNFRDIFEFGQKNANWFQTPLR